MFLKGLCHGVVIILFWLALFFLDSYFELSEKPVGLLIGFGLFIPLLVVGYKFKSINGNSPLVLIKSGNTEILFYPLGIAIYTATFATLVSDASLLFKLLLFPLSLIGHTLSIATNIWVGSWFKRSPITRK